MGVSKNRGETPQIIYLFIGFSIIFTIHLGVALFLGWHPYGQSRSPENLVVDLIAYIH